MDAGVGGGARGEGERAAARTERLGCGAVEVGRQRQLLQADELRAVPRGGADAVQQGGLVLAGVGMPALLDRAQDERRPGRRVDARGRGRRVEREDEPQVISSLIVSSSDA